MSLDVRKLRPSDLVRLLNSTPLAEVVRPALIQRHRDAAGLRIGDGKTIDLVRYTAWLFHQRRDLQAIPDDGGPRSAYERMKERARNRNAEISRSGRDIGPLPAVADPARRAAAAASFRVFCETYFLATFSMPWSDDHRKVMDKIEQAVLHGGLFAMAMPRGSGKTTLCETACLWAVLVGARDFICLIGADEEHAEGMLDAIKSELENNELLAADFPEVVHPIQRLEGIHNRADGQLLDGKHTHIEWTAKRIVLPTVVGSMASGAIIDVAGITARLRGKKHKRPDGRTVRPSLVLVDDPQTDESARSPKQCEDRLRTLMGAVLGLAGPGRKIAGLMTLTVVERGDLADRILDREAFPQWQGERTRMVYAFPADERLWQEYARIRADSLRNDGKGAEATEFYRSHREAMDAGAVIAWPARRNPDELSAIQHAMNLKLQDEAAFWAEYQNEPLPEDDGRADELSADQIAAKINGRGRGEVPAEAAHLTAFIDVQQKALFWVVCAWADDFTGWVLDYGTWPDQRRSWFTLRDIRVTLASVTKGAGLEGLIYAGLERLTADLLGRRWRRDDGAEMPIERCLIDANWGQSTDVVYQFCRQSAHAAVLTPSHGRFVGASSIPFSDYRRKRGDRVGHHWRIPAVIGRHSVRHVLYDTNHWKSFVHARLAVAMGDPGCLSLFGQDPQRHRLIAEHLTSEHRIRTEGRGRTVDEWRLRPDGFDNHWFDGAVGCAVAASMLGSAIGASTGSETRRTGGRLILSQLRDRNRG